MWITFFFLNMLRMFQNKSYFKLNIFFRVSNWKGSRAPPNSSGGKTSSIPPNQSSGKHITHSASQPSALTLQSHCRGIFGYPIAQYFTRSLDKSSLWKKKNKNPVVIFSRLHLRESQCWPPHASAFNLRSPTAPLKNWSPAALLATLTHRQEDKPNQIICCWWPRSASSEQAREAGIGEEVGECMGPVGNAVGSCRGWECKARPGTAWNQLRGFHPHKQHHTKLHGMCPSWEVLTAPSPQRLRPTLWKGREKRKEPSSSMPQCAWGPASTSKAI